jgi:hypothetical protein
MTFQLWVDVLRVPGVVLYTNAAPIGMSREHLWALNQMFQEHLRAAHQPLKRPCRETKSLSRSKELSMVATSATLREFRLTAEIAASLIRSTALASSSVSLR